MAFKVSTTGILDNGKEITLYQEHKYDIEFCGEWNNNLIFKYYDSAHSWFIFENEKGKAMAFLDENINDIKISEEIQKESNIVNHRVELQICKHNGNLNIYIENAETEDYKDIDTCISIDDDMQANQLVKVFEYLGCITTIKEYTPED